MGGDESSFWVVRKKVLNIVCKLQNVNFVIEFDFENYAQRCYITEKKVLKNCLHFPKFLLVILAFWFCTFSKSIK